MGRAPLAWGWASWRSSCDAWAWLPLASQNSAMFSCTRALAGASCEACMMGICAAASWPSSMWA